MGLETGMDREGLILVPYSVIHVDGEGQELL